MYHRRRNQTLLLMAAISTFLFAPACLAKAEAGKPPLAGVVTASGEPHWPLPPNVKQLKKKPRGIELYQYDNSPIGNRAPLLMVHGLLGEHWELFRWKKLTAYLQSDPEFSKKYKIVLARYDTHLPLKEVVPGFTTAAFQVSDAFGGQPLNVVALSIGGNIVQQAMGDTRLDGRIKSVLTLGTPFHGSPLFTTNWMEYSMLRHYHSPVSRLDTTLPYRMYFNRHKNLVADLRWDNTDSMIPDVGKFQYYFPLAAKGNLSAASTANRFVAELNESRAVDKSKFTVYGGYLLNEFATMKGNEFASILKIPYRFTFTLVPEHFGREHPVLRALNQHIARAIVSSPSELRAEGTRYAYGLNDGIAPITSALFLPNAALATGLAITDANVQTLSKLVDVKRARAFRNIDHLTFIDDYHPLRAAEHLSDQLAPSESARPIFEWIKGDILH